MRTLFVLATAFVAGCTTTIPLRPVDRSHPASREAREAPVLLPRAAAVDDAVPTAPPPGGHHHAH